MEQYEYQIIVHPETDATKADVAEMFEVLAAEIRNHTQDTPEWADQSYGGGLHWYVEVLGPELRAVYAKDMTIPVAFPYDRPERIIAVAMSDDGFSTEYVRLNNGNIVMCEGITDWDGTPTKYDVIE